jgi:O-antigen/teichoic acid export membrane protein
MLLIDSIKSKIKNSLIQRMVLYAFSDGISKAIPFMIFPLVASYLTAEEFGYVANFNVLTQLLLAFVVINSHTFLGIDFYKSDENQRSDLIKKIVSFLIINTGIIFCLVFIFSDFIKSYLVVDKIWQFGAVLWAFGMALTYVYQAYLRLNDSTKVFASFQISQAIFSAGLTFLLVVVFKFGLEGRLYSLLVSVLLFGVLGLIYLIKKASLSLNNFIFNLKPLYLFGLPLLPHTISFWIKGGIDKIYITKFISLSSTGIYAFSETFMIVFSMFSLAFFSAYTPHLYKTLSLITESDSPLLKEKIVKETSWFMFFFIILLLLGYFAIRYFILFKFQEKYGESLSYLHYMILSVFISVLYSISSSYLFYFKKTKILGVINFLGSVIHTIVNYFVIQYYGVYGMVITNLIMLSTTTAIIAHLSQKYFPMPWSKLIPIIVKYNNRN